MTHGIYYAAEKDINDWNVVGYSHDGSRAPWRVAGYIQSREQAETMARALNSGLPQLTPPRSRSRKPVKVVRGGRPEYRRAQAEYAVAALQKALQHARYAGAPYTVERIRLALSSARGAVRNAGYRVTRAARG